MLDLIFEWDAAKNDANFAKHGVDFEVAASIFEGPVVEALDERRDYGEIRWICYGMVDEEIYRVVYTRREQNVIRIISAHKAGRRTRRKWIGAVQPR
jgi:uncharacterized DUF497 family protein